MSNLTKNIFRGKKNLQGGVKTVYLFPYVKYNRTQVVTSGQVLTTFPATETFLMHSTATNYSENTEIEGGDVAFNQSFSLQFPKTEGANELYKIVTQRWRAIYLDEIGNIRILGLWNGLEATFNNQTGSGKADMNGYKLDFTGKEDNQAYFLNDLTGFTQSTSYQNYVFMDGFNYTLMDNTNYIF